MSLVIYVVYKCLRTLCNDQSSIGHTMSFGSKYDLPPHNGFTETLSLIVLICFTTVPVLLPWIIINLQLFFGPIGARAFTGNLLRMGLDWLSLYSMSTVVGLPSASNACVSGLSVFRILPNRFSNDA